MKTETATSTVKALTEDVQTKVQSVIFNFDGECEYQARSRGTLLTVYNDLKDGDWVVSGSNAASRAYNSLGSYKRFDSLEDAEKAYKGLAGISALHESLRSAHMTVEILKKVMS